MRQRDGESEAREERRRQREREREGSSGREVRKRERHRKRGRKVEREEGKEREGKRGIDLLTIFLMHTMSDSILMITVLRISSFDPKVKLHRNEQELPRGSALPENVQGSFLSYEKKLTVKSLGLGTFLKMDQ